MLTVQNIFCIIFIYTIDVLFKEGVIFQMKLQRFKENKKKENGILLFTIACVLLITGVFFYKTFATFQVIENEDLIHGSISDPGDIYFAFYYDGSIQKNMPDKSKGYVLDEEKSYCGVTGGNDSDIKVSFTEDETIQVHGVTTSRTKCNLYFVKGVFIKGKGIPLASEGKDGLYEVKHDGSTLEDSAWKNMEYRYAGNDPNNYVMFNDELWRIIGLVNVKTNEGIKQRLKLIKNDAILEETLSWDYKQEGVGSSLSNDGSSDWTDSQLMQLLNGIYYNSTSGDCYKTKSTPETCDFQTTGINENTKKSGFIAEDIIWNLGGASSANVLTSEIYDLERGNEVYVHDSLPWPRSTEWSKENTRNASGKIDKDLYHSIALPYPSDYGYANSKEECISTTKLNEYSSCTSTNWLYNPDNRYNRFLLTPVLSSSHYIFGITSNGYLYDEYGTYGWTFISPVLYLNPNVKIIDGLGTSSDPFLLELRIR